MANTTIQLKHSTVASNVPSALANGEISINSRDGKFFYSTPAGVVTAFNPYPGPSGLDTEIQFNDAGVIGGSEKLTFNKTTGQLTVNGTVRANIFSADGINIYTFAGLGFNQANAAFLQANTPSYTANSAAIYANGAFAAANLSSGAAATSSYANSGFAVANSASVYANAAFATANTITSASSYANSAFSLANGHSAIANSAFIQANAAFVTANTITAAGAYANAAFAAANTAATEPNALAFAIALG